MRLVNVETRKLENFVGKKVPPYAILSHTWGNYDEELSLHDIQTGNIEKLGKIKLEGCCKQAKDHGLGYAWIDTCCINIESSHELSEAINSMFKWYGQASICYTYLSDVPSGDQSWDPESKFFSSRWFERGWTLQELLAPKELHFYDQGWVHIGTKRDMSGEIEKITGIPRRFLITQNFEGASVAQRMSWAARRITTREEDIAYCLLGIFDVHMPMVYGEGSKAFSRLQEAIMRAGDNSILAWGLGLPGSTPSTSTDVLSAGVLATTPSDFAKCGHLVLREQNPFNPFNVSSGRVWINIPLHTNSAGDTYGLLDCGPDDNTEQLIAIPLYKVASFGTSEEYLRPQGRFPILLPRPTSSTLPKSICIRIQRQGKAHRTASRRYWFDIGGYKKIKLRLIENYPPEDWKKGNALIPETNDSEGNTTRRYLARLRSPSEESRDFIVVLELKIQGLRIQPRCHVMISSRDTSLEDLSEKFVYLRPGALGRQTARASGLSVKVIIKEERAGRDPMFLVELIRHKDSDLLVVDASLELERADLKLGAVRILCEKDEVSKEIIRLGWQTDNKLIQLSSTSERLAAVEKSIRKLEEERKSLTQELDEIRQQVDQLAKKNLDATGKEYELSVRERESRLRLEAQSTAAHGPQNWLETTIKTLLHTGEVGRILKNIGDEDPESSEPPRAVEAGINFRGLTPLHWALQTKREAIARLLIEKGADIKSMDDSGQTPLHLAVANGQEATARLLIENGADLEAKERCGLTPLHLVAYHGHEATARLLIEKGAGLEVKDQEGHTPLHIAAGRGQEVTARLLIEKGADLEAKDGHGWTPIHLAAGYGHEATARLLIEKGADLEAKERCGSTPLHLAAGYGDEATARLLVEKGAGLEVKDQLGCTPLDYAQDGGFEAVVQLLVKKAQGVDGEVSPEKQV